MKDTGIDCLSKWWKIFFLVRQHKGTYQKPSSIFIPFKNCPCVYPSCFNSDSSLNNSQLLLSSFSLWNNCSATSPAIWMQHIFSKLVVWNIELELDPAFYSIKKKTFKKIAVSWTSRNYKSEA